MMAKKQWHKLLNYFSSLSNFFLNNNLPLYGRWVPVLFGGLQCVHSAPRQRTAPMAIPATQP